MLKTIHAGNDVVKGSPKVYLLEDRIPQSEFVAALLHLPDFREYADDVTTGSEDLLLICCISQVIIDLAGFAYGHTAPGRPNPVTPQVRDFLEKPNAKLLLYHPDEARDFRNPYAARLLSRYIQNTLMLPLKKVILSCTDFLNRDFAQGPPQTLGYDWVYLREKSGFDVANIVDFNPETKSKHLVMLNRRGNVERFACCLFLYSHFRDRCHLSYLTCDAYPAAEVSRFGVGVEKLGSFIEALPLALDQSQHHEPDMAAMQYIGRFVKSVRWHVFDEIYDFVNDAFVMLVFETNADPPGSPCQQVSEKTYKPIKGGIPFMIFTSKPGILRHLRSLGFRTFSPWINEDFDLPMACESSEGSASVEEEYFHRYALLLEEVRRICAMSRQEIVALYMHCLPIVKHNLAVLSSLDNVPELPIPL